MEQMNVIAECAAFVVMLSLSIIVGLYYGCVEAKQNTVSEYLLGGKHMSVFPITMSLIASHISGITLLGIPAEVYSNGTQYLISCGSYIIVIIIVIKIFLPVFYELQLISIYEYLELRFNSNVRILLSLFFWITNIFHIAIVIYVPAMAFNQVTGLNVHYVTPFICSICIFYTTIGGLKAVVWTDAIQSVFTAVSTIIVIVLGLIRVGGFGNVIRANRESDRLEFFRMDPDPFLRHTFWTVFTGMTVSSITSLGLSAGSVQRFVSLPTKKMARNSLIYFTIGMFVVKTLTGFTGMLIFTMYKNCDPNLANYINGDKNIVSYYVMDVASKFPGITGLFVSGIVSAALSTMSAQLNTIACTVYEDFVVKIMGVKVSESTASVIMKSIVVITGVICVALVFLIENINGIIQVSISISSVTTGALVTVFTLGICFPWANSKGAMCGLLASFSIMAFIVVGAQIAQTNGDMKYVKKNVSIAGCPPDLHFKNISDYSGLYRMNEDLYVSTDIWKIFTVSYMHYNTIGLLVGITVGLAVSLLFPTEQNLDPKLFAPCIRNFMYPKYMTTQKNIDETATSKYQPVSQDIKDTKL